MAWFIIKTVLFALVAAGLAFLLADFQKSAIVDSRNLESQRPATSTLQTPPTTSAEPQRKRASNIQPYPPTLLSAEIILNLTRVVSESIGRLEGRWLDAGFDKQKPDENYYRGEKNQFGQRHGVGRIEAPEGDAFLGQWVRDLRHGYGGVSFAGGELITAEWKFDQPHGMGEHQTSDGYHYRGEFKAGQPNGVGLATFSDGTTYHGQFKEGQPHGYGIEISSNKKHRYEGEFKAGVKEGRAKLFNHQTGEVLFLGSFKNGQPEK